MDIKICKMVLKTDIELSIFFFFCQVRALRKNQGITYYDYYEFNSKGQPLHSNKKLYEKLNYGVSIVFHFTKDW